MRITYLERLQIVGGATTSGIVQLIIRRLIQLLRAILILTQLTSRQHMPLLIFRYIWFFSFNDGSQIEVLLICLLFKPDILFICFFIWRWSTNPIEEIRLLWCLSTINLSHLNWLGTILMLWQRPQIIVFLLDLFRTCHIIFIWRKDVAIIWFSNNFLLFETAMTRSCRRIFLVWGHGRIFASFRVLVVGTFILIFLLENLS